MNLARIENRLLVLSEPVGVAVYDFDFELHFACTHPFRLEAEEPGVLRKGAVPDYAAEYAACLAIGLRLVNSPEQQQRASELEAWYPRIRELTPRTRVFDALPPADAIEAEFAWPVFLKGSRQTSKHNPDLAVIADRAHYARACARWRTDPVLHWQKPVVREFVPLAPVPGAMPGKIRPSVEFRAFFWRGECVGCGPYWYQAPPYGADDLADGLALAHAAARAVDVPFLVVDFARTVAGRWIVIECNDAQESGYAGVVPQQLWREVLARV
jgi:hypothetical protein